MRGNGAASVTPASSSRPLPVTHHTGRNWLNADTVESREGVRCCPAHSSTDVCQRGAVRQCVGVEWALIPRGHGSPWDWYTRTMTSTIQWANLCLTSVADKELLRASEAPGAVHVYAQCSYGTSKAGSASSEGSACRFTTWSRKGVLGTLITYPGWGLKTTWE